METKFYRKMGTLPANVIESLHQLRKMVPKDVVIEIRSDGGLEFNNTTVREYCNKFKSCFYFYKEKLYIQEYIYANFFVYV